MLWRQSSAQKVCKHTNKSLCACRTQSCPCRFRQTRSDNNHCQNSMLRIRWLAQECRYIRLLSIYRSYFVLWPHYVCNSWHKFKTFPRFLAKTFDDAQFVVAGLNTSFFSILLHSSLSNRFWKGPKRKEYESIAPFFGSWVRCFVTDTWLKSPSHIVAWSDIIL